MNKVVGKGADGKAFIKALDECKDKKDIFDLLSKSMDNDTLRDRVGHVNDNEKINNLHDKIARVNIGAGLRASHGDLAILAAKRYSDITGKNVKFFKAECNKYITLKEAEKNKTSGKVMQATNDMAR